MIFFKPFKRLVADSDGLAMTEFALGLPLFLAVAMGGLEFANLGMAHLRISQIAMTVSDNAGRADPSIDETDINEIFAGGNTIGDSIAFEANGRVVLSSLEHNGLTGSDEGQMINWQRCMGALNFNSQYGVEDDGRTDDSLKDGMGKPGNMIFSSPGGAIMFVEVAYEYQPLMLGSSFSRTIRHETAFSVRTRDNYNITNTRAISTNTCS